MKATIIDVAKESGVSVATVSRVVNGNYPVREKTRIKVEDAIKKLEYVPNLQARELNMQRSSSIGVVVPSFDNMFFVQVLDGIEEHLRQSSYSLLLACAQNDAAREEECVRDFITRNVSGVIVVSPNTETAVSEFYENTAARLPLVFVNSARELAGISYVTSDQSSGARAAPRGRLDEQPVGGEQGRPLGDGELGDGGLADALGLGDARLGAPPGEAREHAALPGTQSGQGMVAQEQEGVDEDLVAVVGPVPGAHIRAAAVLEGVGAVDRLAGEPPGAAVLEGAGSGAADEVGPAAPDAEAQVEVLGQEEPYAQDEGEGLREGGGEGLELVADCGAGGRDQPQALGRLGEDGLEAALGVGAVGQVAGADDVHEDRAHISHT